MDQNRAKRKMVVVVCERSCRGRDRARREVMAGSYHHKERFVTRAGGRERAWRAGARARRPCRGHASARSARHEGALSGAMGRCPGVRSQAQASPARRSWTRPPPAPTTGAIGVEAGVRAHCQRRPRSRWRRLSELEHRRPSTSRPCARGHAAFQERERPTAFETRALGVSLRGFRGARSRDPPWRGRTPRARATPPWRRQRARAPC